MWEKTQPLPLHALVIEALSKHGSSMSDEELLEELRGFVKGLPAKDLRMALFRLEVEGIVRVTGITKNKKRVELIVKG